MCAASRERVWAIDYCATVGAIEKSFAERGGSTDTAAQFRNYLIIPSIEGGASTLAA